MSELLGRVTLRFVALAVASIACFGTFATPAHALPPGNDAFPMAEPVTGAVATATGTNVEATKETGEPNHAGYTGGKSVWYRWTAPQSGVATVDTFGSSFDTLLAVYTGATVDGLHFVAGNDDYDGARSRVRIPVTAGQEYRIAVDGYWASEGSITLHVTSGAGPANDAFANAASLTGDSATATASNVGATREPGEPNHNSGFAQASVWWTWTAPSTGGVTISTAGSGFSTALAAYTGTVVSGLVPVASSSDRLTFRAIEGTTYRIAVDGAWSNAEGPISLALSLAPPPSNDLFAAATDLGSGANVTTTGHNLGASPEPGEPSHYSYLAAGPTVWYAWTAPADGSLTLRADGSFSRALAVYTGTQVSGLTRVPTQAQSCGCGPQQIRVRVEAGETYRIALDGLYGAMGTFNLTLDLVARPANDDFADAAPLAGPTDSATGTNVGATQEPGEPIHEENYYDPSVWYSWTAPSSGGVTLDTAGSALDTVVAVYTGDAVSALSRVATTPAAGATREKRSFRAAAGVTYRIAIDGRGAQMGTFALALTTTPPPANDLFATAAPLTGEDTTVNGDTLGATGENGEPNGGTAGATVWYSWTATGTGRVRLTLPTTDFAAAVAAYTGTAPNALTQVGWSTFPVVAGTTYRIQVHGGERPWRGRFSLRLQYMPAPANDDFANAAVLTGADASGSSNNAAATKEPGEPAHNGGNGRQSVWWQWTAPDDGRATIALSGSFDWAAAVYTGGAVGSLTEVGRANYGRITFAAAKGTTYRIAVDSWSSHSEGGAISLGLKLVDAPANDHFADATVLSGSSEDATGKNVNATREYAEPWHAGSDPSHSVWYRWRAPASGPVTIDTAGSGFDTVLGVYTGSWVDALWNVASNDDAAGSTQARVTFEAQSGTVYRIAVDGKAGANGAVALSLRHGTPPANDAFAAAQELTGEEAQATGTTVFATKQAGEPDHAGNDGGASTWYRWTAPAGGELRVSTAGSAIDTILGVYTGEAVGSLRAVAANDDAAAGGTASELVVSVVAGTEYRIAVDGKNDRHGPVQGATSLALELTPAHGGETAASETVGGGDGAGTGGETAAGGSDSGGDAGSGDSATSGDAGSGDSATSGAAGSGDSATSGAVGSGDSATSGAAGSGDSATSGDAVAAGGDGSSGGDSGSGGDSAASGGEASAGGASSETSAGGTPPAPLQTGAQSSTATSTGGQTATGPTTARRAPAFAAPAAPAPLTVSATVPAQRIAGVLRRGVVGTATCSAACRLSVAVVLRGTGTTARTAATVRAATVARTAGAATPFTAKLSPTARRLLRTARSLRATVVVTAQQADGATSTATRRTTLRR